MLKHDFFFAGLRLMLIRLRQFDKVKVYKVAEFNLWQNFASFPEKKKRELYRDDRLATNGMEKY